MANDILELLIKASVSSDGGLDKIDAAIKQIGKDSGLTGQALSNLQSRVSSEFQKMTAAGLNFEQQIKRLSQAGDTMGRGVSGSAKEIAKDLQDAANAAKNAQAQVNATKQALGGIQGATTNPFGALTNSASSFAATLGPLGLAIGGVVTVATLGAKAMFDLVDSQGKAAQQTVNMATQMGITAGAMKKLQVEGELIGVSFQTMQMASRQLANAMEEPTGAGKRAAQSLRDLGVATHTLDGSLRGEGQVFEDVIERLAGMTDHTKQVEEATRLFGARGSASLQLVIGRYKELDQTTRSLGYGDTTKLTQELAKGEEKINAMRSAWDLFKAKLAETISPIVIPAIVSLTTGSWNPFHTQKGGGLSDQIEADQKYEKQQKADAQNAINKQIAGSYQSSLSPVDAIKAKISDSKKTLADDEALLANPAGVDPAKVEATKQAALGLRTEIDKLEASLKRTEERISETRKLTEDAKYPDLQSPIEFRRLLAERKKSADLLGPGNDTLLDASPQFGLEKTTESIRKFFLKIGEEARKDAEKTLKDADSHGGPFAEQNEAYKQQLKENVQISESDYSSAQRQLKLVNDADKASAERQQQRAIQLAELSGVGGEGNAVALGTQARLGSAAALRNDQLGDIQKQLDALNAQSDKTLDDRKQINELTTQGLEVELNYNKEIASARMDAEMKLLELRQKELDGYKKQADQIFDALRTPGSQGIRGFFNAQGTDLARTLFSNATAPILQTFGHAAGGLITGQTATDAQGNETRTALGKLLQGTIFDSAKSGKAPQVVALDANTQALNRLTGSLTGKSIGGTPAPSPDPNSITGVIAQEATGGVGAIGGGSSAVASVAGSQLAALASEGNAAGVGQFGISAPIGAGSLFSLLNPNIAAPGATAQQNGLSQFVTGASKGIGNWNEIFTGQGPNQVDQLTGETIPTYVSPEQQAGAAIGTGAVLAGGTLTAVQSFEKGGASGVLGGIGAAAGTAALLDPDPTSKAVLAATATVAELVKSILPDPKAVREASISNQIAYEQYLAPAAMSRTLSDSGGFEQVNDKYGLPSSTSYTSVAKSEPYKYLASQLQTPGSLYQNWSYEMGTVTEPYQTPGAIPTYANPSGNQAAPIIINNHISAVDQASFNSFGPKLASSLQQQVLEGHPVAAALQRAILGA